MLDFIYLNPFVWFWVFYLVERGIVTLHELIALYCGSPEQALIELSKMSLYTLRCDLEIFLKTYLIGNGVDLPHGYTWGELVSELSQDSTDKEYL